MRMNGSYNYYLDFKRQTRKKDLCYSQNLNTCIMQANFSPILMFTGRDCMLSCSPPSTV